MAEFDDRRPVLQSLLDRLTDEDPDKDQEIALTGKRLERLVRDAMRRDVQSFLNSRRRCIELPPNLEYAKGTIIDYGIPDFVGHTLSTERRRTQFIQMIEGYLKQHEPRFKSVKLTLINGVDISNRSLQFRISAEVYADPAPESLVMDSRVEPVSRSFSVEI